MSVRAKFKYMGYEASLTIRKIDETKGWGKENLEEIEIRTLKFAPVYGNGDPNHENTKFWRYSPTGEFKLGTVNPEAWSQFEFGKEYYIDITKAE